MEKNFRVFYRWSCQEFTVRSRPWAPCTGAIKPCSEFPVVLHPQTVQGMGNQSERAKADGLYFDLLGVSLQPTTEISPNDGMHFFNFKFQLADSYLTSEHQNHIYHHLFIWYWKTQKSSTMLQEAAWAAFSALPQTPGKRSCIFSRHWYRKW